MHTSDSTLSGFSSHWLALREPIDARSRSADLVNQLRSLAPDKPLTILDMACGTGANFRYLATRLLGSQEWLLIDHDAALLSAVREHAAQWALALGLRIEHRCDGFQVLGSGFHCRVRLQQIDLVADFDHVPIEGHWLVTASALLDLVALDWLDAMVKRCRLHGACLLFALTYDGRFDFEPPTVDDALIRRLVNQHQEGDKGFGAALGPHATSEAIGVLSGRGYQVSTAETPWCLGHGDNEVQHYLLRDWTQAAAETAPEMSARVTRWGERRDRHLAGGHSSLSVGHRDLLATP